MKPHLADLKKIDLLVTNGCYEDALQILNKFKNSNPEISHRIGLIYATIGDFKEAIFYLKKTKNIAPNDRHVSLNLAKAYADAKEKKLAMDSYEDLIKIFPDFAEGWINYSSFLNDNNFYEKTITTLSKLINVINHRYELHANLGYAYKIKKEYAKALFYFERSIVLNPRFIPSHINKIDCMIKLQLFDFALDEISKLELISDSSELPYLKLNLLTESKKYHQASEYLLGNENFFGEQFCLAKMAELSMLEQRIEDSLVYIELALKKFPNNPESWSNKGIVLNLLTKYVEAKELFLRALELNPQDSLVWSNLGVTQMMLMEYDEARLSFDNAKQIDPYNVEATWNESLLDLIQGNLIEGFKKFEYRFLLPSHQTCPIKNLVNISQISSIANKKIFVWAEQGFGDSIQFVRYIPYLLEEKAEIYLLVQKELTKLFKLNYNLFITDNIEEFSQIPFDAEVSLASLPYFFKTDFQSIPNYVPYIQASSEKVKFYKENLYLSDRIKIGIAISGRQDYDSKNGNFRPIPLHHFDVILDKYEIHIIQKDFLNSDKKFIKENSSKLFVHSDLNDFTDTAALINLMDIIVSVDTSLVHLAGAMGVKTILLCSTPPTWRWFLNITYSPWYPTVSIIRQENYGKWDGVIEKLDHKIHEIINFKPH